MLDIIIATSNRFSRALMLAESLIEADNTFIGKIFLVDSTDNQKRYLDNNKKVVHLLSKHKNQPYQRFLGFQHATSPVLLFLDDDMEIANKDWLDIILKTFNHEGNIAMAINFKDKHEDTSLGMIPKSKFSQNLTYTKKFVNWFTAYPNLEEGVFGFCGVRGPQPKLGGVTSYVSGGAFVARRKELYENFNFQLFDLYEQNIGKGEDAIMGYTLSKQGNVVYNPELLFYHNDQKDSAYSINHFSYSRRVTCSRKYLSLEKARLDNSSLLFAKLHFHWHTFWRILGLGINYLFQRTDTRQKMLLGALSGWKSSIIFSYKYLSKKNKEFE